jgi:hypothetical protein
LIGLLLPEKLRRLQRGGKGIVRLRGLIVAAALFPLSGSDVVGRTGSRPAAHAGAA